MRQALFFFLVLIVGVFTGSSIDDLNAKIDGEPYMAEAWTDDLPTAVVPAAPAEPQVEEPPLTVTVAPAEDAAARPAPATDTSATAETFVRMGDTLVALPAAEREAPAAKAAYGAADPEFVRVGNFWVRADAVQDASHSHVAEASDGQSQAGFVRVGNTWTRTHVTASVATTAGAA
jgi:hypothetical protein